MQAFRLQEGGHYLLEAALGEGDRYEPPGFPGVTIDLTKLFADIPALDSDPLDIPALDPDAEGA